MYPEYSLTNGSRHIAAYQHESRLTVVTRETLRRIAEPYLIEAGIRASHQMNDAKSGKPVHVR